jgi:cell wall-associated NlpC family hydrolase
LRLVLRRPGRHRVPRRSLTVALTLLLGVLAPGLASAPAHADPQGTIASKTAEAKRLEAAIEANGTRISILDEQYNDTRLQIERANAGLADAEARIASAKRQSAHLHGMLQGRAALLYTQAGSRTPFPELDATNIQELGSLTKYSDAAAQRDDNLISDLSQARELLNERQDELNQAKAKAVAQEKALDSQRTSLENAQAKQQDLLSQVKGELATLVKQEQRRREAAAAAAARAAFAARSAQSASTGGGSSSSGGGSHFAPSAPDPNVPAPSGGAATAIATARAQLGKPYVYAAAGPNSFDCSGLTMFAWASAGVSLPHSSGAQFASLPHVAQSQLAPGDLVFFGSPIHHVGMYLGGGMMIHAPQTGDVVKISAVWRSDYAGAARPG